MNLIAKIKKLNLKEVVKVFTLIWGLVLIVVMTITNVGLKQEFNFLEWLGNSLILFGIMCFSLILGESIGGDKQKEKTGGLFQNSLTDYNDKRKEIDADVIYFTQFFQWYLPQELEAKKINYLIENNIPIEKATRIVKYCSYEDLFRLKGETIEINGVMIRKLTESEVPFVEEVLKGEIKIEANNPSYYLSAFGKGKSKSILEVGNQLDKEIKFNKVSNRILKITVSLGVSLGMALLTINEFMKGDDAQAWLNLVSRLTAFITSFFSGWLSSVIDVKLKAQKLINKRDVLSLFQNSLAKGLFVPKTEDELAREEIKKQEEEKQKAKENVIIPQTLLLDQK